MTTTHSTTYGDGEPSHEITGARTFAGRMRRFRVGAEAGEVFECDADFDGLTLTIEVSDMQDGENLIRILAGWLPVPDAMRAWAEAAEAERDAAVMEQSEEVRRRIEAEAERDRIAAEWAEVSQRNYQRAKKAEAERDRLHAIVADLVAEHDFGAPANVSVSPETWRQARAALSGGDDG